MLKRVFQNLIDLMTEASQPGLRAVLFDLDGTLLDSVPGIHQAADRALFEQQQRHCTLEQVRHWVGNGPRVLMERALGTADSDIIEAGLQTFERHYAETLFNAELYPGVADGLQQLLGAGLRLACLTNKPSPFTRVILQHVGIDAMFDLVICGDQVEHPKPHPQSLLVACDHLKVHVKEAIMVGDSVNDLLPARVLEMPSVAVTWGYHGGASLNDHAPAFMARDFTDVVSFAMQRQFGAAAGEINVAE